MPKSYERVGKTNNCTVMKKEYVKVELKAKNAPSGSYAAGCPAETSEGYGGGWWCKRCELAK